MNTITLYKPLVLRNSLDDMTESQRRIAHDLLINHLALIPGKDGFRFEKMSDNKHIPSFFLYGSEAVCYYRQALGLPDISIKMIDVDDIITSIEDFNTLYDIIFLLNNVNMRNNRVRKLRETGAPAIIMWNEDRVLQEYLETLQNNKWAGRPVINHLGLPYDMRCEGNDEETKMEVLNRKSLADIGYDLMEHSTTCHCCPLEKD